MRIRKILNQNRRDFQAEYECEHCGDIHKGSGYDDANFHNNVIPAMICKKCDRTSEAEYRPLTTKYPEGMQL